MKRIPSESEKLAAVGYEPLTLWSWTCPCPPDGLTDAQFVEWVDANGQWVYLASPVTN